MYNRDDVTKAVYESPWRNAYWFTRNLLNTDQYGAIGKGEKLMQDILLETKAVLVQHLTDEEKLKVCFDITRNKIQASAKAGTKTINLREEFLAYLEREIKTIQDFIVFLVTIEYVVLPTNKAINNIPSDDLAYTETTAKNILETLGRVKVGTILSTWGHYGS